MLFPCLLCYWRGINDLLAVYIFPEDRAKNVLACTAVGALSPMAYLLAPLLDKALKGSSNLAYVVVTRTFMYAYGLLYMFLWYGVWNLSDHYLGRDWLPAVPWLAGSTIMLLALRCIRATMWPPVLVCLDSNPNLLSPSTRFGSSVSIKILHIHYEWINTL